MYKYIITWVIVSIQSAPCPDANKESEFGIKSNVSCAVFHTQSVEGVKQRIFYSKDSVNDFMKRLDNFKSGSIFSMRDDIRDIRLDSLKIK